MASTVWRGYISFGLVSIPVRLFRAARAERISLRRLYRRPEKEEQDEMVEERNARSSRSAGTSLEHPQLERPLSDDPGSSRHAVTAEPALTPVKQISVRNGSGEILPSKSIVKGYEYQKDRFVALQPEELKNAAPKTSTAMEIQEFVQLAEIDPVYFETSYYVRPEEAGEKAYALLYRSLQASGLVAIAQFAMHGREHAVVLRPGKKGLLAHTMYFASEVRAEEEYRADVVDVGKKELDLAQTLIHSLAAPFEPEKYRDTYREKIQSIIDSKVKGLPIASAPAVPQQAEVVDIADALRRSLANLKKPAASASEQFTRKMDEAKTPPRTKKAER
ncbi:MAG: Ku protein [Acidobacteriaceae bacterium]|nr:Ku protein [Acidobacteriaceae bacterium]